MTELQGFVKMLINFKKLFRKSIHRSFRLSRKRDYHMELSLPGYFKFTNLVNKTLRSNSKLFTYVVLFYAFVTLVLIGMASQDYYVTLSNILSESGGDTVAGFWGSVGGAGLMFVTAISGGFSQDLSEAQQIYALLIFLLTWLTVVWLLRNILAGNKVKLRDGLYNSGSPIIATILVSLFMLIQMIPMGLAIIFYVAAASTGLLDGGVEAMLFWISAGLLSSLSLYWLIGSFFALIIITLPGMYPAKALKSATELVRGRRLRILMRVMWMVTVVIIMWALILVPSILFDSWLKSLISGIDWLPLIPVVMLLLSSATVVWVSAYVYLLYRKVVENVSESN
jgi:hypothetical protein